jgi:hypothetical protein
LEKPRPNGHERLTPPNLETFVAAEGVTPPRHPWRP